MSSTFELLATWAWQRHHNVLSWYVRPLFLLPYCWFAYRRSVVGIAATLVTLVTSNGAVIFKIGWTFVVDGGGASALAHLPAALAGLAVVDLATVWWAYRRPAARAGTVG